MRTLPENIDLENREVVIVDDIISTERMIENAASKIGVLGLIAEGYSC